MTKSDPAKAEQRDRARKAVRDLVRLARDKKAIYQDDLAARSGASSKTIWNFEAGATWPSSRTLRGIESALGFTTGVLDDVLTSEAPEGIKLEHLWAAPEDSDRVGGISDQDLVWALTERLQTRDATIRRLTEEVASLREQLAETAGPELPANVYDLAADKDRSGHGRAIRDEIDSAGEESQDH